MSEPWFDAPPPLLPEVLALNARWLGNDAAVICGETTLSWREFHRQACQVANGLHSMGLEPGDHVAVLMDNSADMVVAMFGTIIAGGVTVPLNTLVTDRGLQAMIADADARCVMVGPEHAERLAGLRETATRILPQGWICTGEARENWVAFEAWREAQDHADPALPLDEAAECNIIYSSGTTGQPKGIVHTHRRRLDWFYDLALALRYDRTAVNLCPIGLFSNISWAGMGCTFLTGGTIVVMPAFDAGEWLGLVERHGVTHSAMVPVQFQRILEAGDFDRHDVSSIKSLMCCGSPLPPELKSQIMDRLAPRLIELYGLTEGVITTLEPEQARERMDSVGRPLMGTDLVILDEDDRPCPPGQSGEIAGRGRILMAGYHQRPEANREATWTDPQGRRWLRTGDIGYLDEDGYLYLKDRKKDLIISGGQNIYPADIESVMAEHPEVLDVAVIGIDNPRWGESPFAVVVGDEVTGEESSTGAEALCEWTNARVGKHQRLVGLAFVDELPRNANGKILKRELREQYRGWLNQHGAGSS